jgi:hypothetical protein
MRSRDTSKESWERLVESGLLGPKHKAIYISVALNPGLTANEHVRLMREKGRIKGDFDSNTHSRFTELRDMGCIREVERRKCTTSGRPAVTWEVTGRFPDPDWRQRSKGKGRRPVEDEVLDLRERVRALERENRRLKALVESRPLSKPQHSRPLGKPQLSLPLGGAPISKGPFG